jgi:hypothetical protein
MAAPREPRVVAELGRPETPEETATRKAENSRAHRANQTLRNLILSLIATVAVLIVFASVVVRHQPGNPKPTDWHSVAAQAQVDAPGTLTDPVLPSGWTANNVSLSTGTDKVSTWYIGFITPKGDAYVGMKQGFNANDTWVAQQLKQQPATGTTEIDGVAWDVYDHRTADDPGNLAYALVTTIGTTDYLVYGTATTTEIDTVATAVLEGIK